MNRTSQTDQLSAITQEVLHVSIPTQISEIPQKKETKKTQKQKTKKSLKKSQKSSRFSIKMKEQLEALKRSQPRGLSLKIDTKGSLATLSTDDATKIKEVPVNLKNMAPFRA